ncbi:hypothetical protein ACIBKX_35805 [Streptomyces sp. NPDC050658]|uniref:hypothetical protein n=1 Tax=unclassified Streptomyces TaxID=2593676 RepID=UPI003424E35D
MGRGGVGVGRVSVVVRAGAWPLGWMGVLAAGVGALPSGLTGRRIGMFSGAALFVLAAATVTYVRRNRYTALAREATRVGRYDVLQDRAVTVRNWRRAHRRWLATAFLGAVGTSFVIPVAAGAAMAGAGVGLWAKAAWLGHRERDADALYWVRVDWLNPRAGAPAAKAVKGYRTTGPAAGDAAPGGARRRTTALRG